MRSVDSKHTLKTHLFKRDSKMTRQRDAAVNAERRPLMIAQPGHAIAHIDPADIQTHTGSTRGSMRRHEAAPVRCRHGALLRRASAHVHGHEPVLRPSTRLLRAPPRAHKRHDKKAPPMPPTPPPSASSAPRGRPRCPPCSPSSLSWMPLNLPDSNHRSEAVLEHSRRSGGRKRDVALALLCSLLRRPSRNWRWSRPAKGATKRSASARKRGTADQEQDRSPDWLLRGSGESVGNRDARAVDQRGQPEGSPQPQIRPRCTWSGCSQSSRAGTRNRSRP